MNKNFKMTFLLIMAMVSGILFCSFSPYEVDYGKLSHGLNGTWQNGPFTLYINENTYFCKIFNQDYSRGIVVYDGQKVGIVSSYAWNFSQNRWIEYNEAVTGEYIYQNNEVTLSKITGRYEPLNGTWKKINSNNYLALRVIWGEDFRPFGGPHGNFLTRWNFAETLMNGAILENYAAAEIVKSYENSGKDLYPYFYRDWDMKKINLLLEGDGFLHPTFN